MQPWAALFFASVVHGDRALWSNQNTREKVCPRGEDDDCVIPADMDVLLDASANLGSLKILGSLTWDLTKDDLELKAGWIVAEGPTGAFEMGTPQNPMLKKATIYIKDNGRQHSSRLLGRVLGTTYIVGSRGGPGPSWRIHGRPLSKTWSLLVENALEDTNTIRIEGDVATADGTEWRVGDRIGVAPSGMMGNRIGEEFTIKSLAAEQFGDPSKPTTVITLDRDLTEPKLGRPDLPLQSEVVLLSRNVVMTGDDTSDSMQGWHGISAAGQFSPVAEYGGTFQVEYARQERCGQARVKGSYCLHFHLMGDCGPIEGGDEKRPRCIFRGNALQNGYQRGLTVHGTHRSLVDNNVLWNVKGAGIYVEDGNEMGNTISYNVNVCPINTGGCHQCMVFGTDNGEADAGQQSGMWVMSTTNDYLFNRMVNHWNGFFMQTSFAPFGRGFVEGRVCTTNLPFGNFTGNVHHSNCRFGFYPDKNWPRRVTRSIATNGEVPDFSRESAGSCSQFTAEGKDRGAPAIAADGLDWGNNLVGQYDLGDVQYLRYHSINNLHGMYWKATKNFATMDDIGDETWDTGMYSLRNDLQPKQLNANGGLPWSHMKDCKFEWISFWDDAEVSRIMGTAARGVGHLYGPGGHGTFIMDGGEMSGMMGNGIGSNQHCNLAGTGGMCAPTFEIYNNFSATGLAVPNQGETPWIMFGVGGGESRMVSYAAKGNELDGWKGIAHGYMEYLLHLRSNPDGSGTQACQRAFDINIQHAHRFNWGILCTVTLRRMQIWSPQLREPPTIKIKTESHMPQEIPYLGVFMYMKYKRGYGMTVAPGYHYEIAGLEYFPGEGTIDTGVTLEFSDRVNGQHLNPGVHDSITFTFIKTDGATRKCTVSSDHDRSWIGWEGAFEHGHGACTDGANDTAATTKAPTPAPTPAPPTPPPPPPTPAPPTPPTPAPPPGPAPGECADRPCPHRDNWPRELHECDVAGIEGTEIATTGVMRVCNDCVERCFMQMANCIAVVALGTGDSEQCTYYSAISGTKPGPATYRAIVTDQNLALLRPVQRAPQTGIRTPDGCNSHPPPMPTGSELQQEMYLCVVDSVEGELLTPAESTPLDFYNDCATRCFIQFAQQGKTCVAVRSREIGNGEKAACTYYKSVTRVHTASSSQNSYYTMMAKDTLPWEVQPLPPTQSPGPSPNDPEANFWRDNALWIALGSIGVVLLGGIAAFCLCAPRQRLYGPQDDAEMVAPEMSRIPETQS